MCASPQRGSLSSWYSRRRRPCRLRPDPRLGEDDPAVICFNILKDKVARFGHSITAGVGIPNVYERHRLCATVSVFQVGDDRRGVGNTVEKRLGSERSKMHTPNGNVGRVEGSNAVKDPSGVGERPDQCSISRNLRHSRTSRRCFPSP